MGKRFFVRNIAMHIALVNDLPGMADIIVSRNREGSIGSFKLKFDGRYGSFEETDQG